MKLWSRDFTRREKSLLVILSVILVVLLYFLAVDRPVRTAIASANAEAEALRTELAAVQGKALRLEKLKKELGEVKENGELSRMESYNNSREEIALLNEILADTVDYSIDFSDVTRDGDQIRRNFTLQFRTRDYETMRQIIGKLCDSKYRCLVDEIRCQTMAERNELYVAASLTATFYETMVGGTPDSGLPENQAKPGAQTGARY